MNHRESTWEARLASLWTRIGDFEDSSFVEAMCLLTTELSEGDPVALFELGAAHDSTGAPQQAVELYESALQAGLSGPRLVDVNYLDRSATTILAGGGGE